MHVFSSLNPPVGLCLPRHGVSFALVLSLFCLVGCGPPRDRQQGVQLVLSTSDLSPETTFEIRFDQPMVRAGEIGATQVVSAVVFSPAVKGDFIWTSSRSGVFTPSEPLRLGTEYVATLHPKLASADGQPLRAKLRRVLRTPALGVLECDGPSETTNATAMPEYALWFNAEVFPAEIGRHAGFVDDARQWVPVAAKPGRPTDAPRSWRGPQLTWGQRFAQARQPTGPGPEQSADPNERTALNLVLVSPQRPLPPGLGWKLILSPGYRSADGSHRAAVGEEFPLGDVQKMKLIEAEITHVLHRGPRLELTFSRNLDERLTNSWPDWVTISPAVEDPCAVVNGRNLLLAGKWRRGQSYEIAVSPGVPSDDGQVLLKEFSATLPVPPVPPRLYFPAFSAEQFAGGRRAISLLGVNVSSIQVRAKLLDPQTVIHALRGYEGYVKRNRFYREPEPYRRVDYNLVAGRTVLNQTFSLFPPPDECGELKLEWDRLLKGRKTGIVFLDAERFPGSATDELLGTQCVIQLTDLGVLWKMASDEVQACVFSYQTGQPVAGAKLGLYSEENEPLAQAAADASGLAKLPRSAEAQWLMATLGEDAHAVRLDRDLIHTWRFPETRGDYRDWQNSSATRVAFFTDRDVYRPGENVFFKLFERELTPGGLRVQTGTTGVVTCADSRGREFFMTNIALSALGSFDGTVLIPEGARGFYTLKASLRGGQDERSRSIQIADYRPAAFEVRAPLKPILAPEEILEVPVSARYQFGASLQNAQFKWYLSAEDADFQPAGFDSYWFNTPREGHNWQPAAMEFRTNGTGQLVAGSNTVLRAALPRSPGSRPVGARLYLEVTDLNLQTITRSAETVQHSSDFYLGLKREEQMLAAGRELPLEVVAVGNDGRPWPNPVKAKATLSRIQWEVVQVQGTGLSVQYRNHAFLTNIAEKEIEMPPGASPWSRDPNYRREIEGYRLTGWTPAEAGQYLLTLTATDAAGRPVSNSAQYHVSAESHLAWNYRDDVSITLVPDKLVYHPGEKATLLVKAPFSGQAVVTIEREKVLRSFVTKLEGNAPSIEVPLEAGDTPNVYVGVALVRGAANSSRAIPEPEYRLGYTCLKVEDPARRLAIDLSCSNTNCLPGAAVSVTARVADAAGAPVPDAEITLYAVDEGVLSLTDYTVPDPFEIMFARRELGVTSGITLPFLLSEDPERLQFHNKGYLGGGGGMERVRQRFLACAFWKGALRTGTDGTATVEFTAPDSITRYRVVAVGHTAAQQFGTGIAQFTVSKPVMIEPALPQFAHAGDRLQARAIVFNQTADPGEFAVSLELDALAASPGEATLTRTVPVPAGGSAAVEFPVLFREDGSSAWTWRARSSGIAQVYTDAVRSTIEVRSPLPLLRETRLITQLSAETNLLAAINPQLLEGKGAVRVRIADTRLVALGEAVRHLLTYPYGCGEQTSSSLLPWVVLQRTPDLVPLVDRTPTESAKAAEAGVRRLLSMQTSSGGLGYWPGDSEPNHWVSAYGGLVLALARQAGMVVADAEWELLLNYLSQELRAPGHNPDAQCLALYVLALGGKPQPAYHTTWFEQRAKLSREGRALLALAAGAKQPELAVALLDEQARPNRAVPAPFGGRTRQDAIELMALCLCRPEAPETARQFEALLGAQEHGHWGTTQGNAWSMLAMTEYLRVNEKTGEPIKASLRWGQETRSREFGATCRLVTEKFELSPKLATEPMRLTKTGSRPLYLQVSVESRVAAAPQIAQDRGYGVRRTYWKLDDQNVPTLLENLRIGDRVLVSVRVTVPKAAQYLALEDPLPALLEPIQSGFKTQQTADPNIRTLLDGDAFELPSDFHEVRADRVMHFVNDLAPGTYVVRHLARVRASGSAVAPGTKAESMYEPARFGLAAPETLSAK